jgi:hypothetical protein
MVVVVKKTTSSKVIVFGLEQIKLRIETVAAVTFTTFVTAGIRGVG